MSAFIHSILHDPVAELPPHKRLIAVSIMVIVGGGTLAVLVAHAAATA